MKRVNISVILLVPMAIGLVLYFGATGYRNSIATDVTDIRWDYGSTERFKVRGDGYPLAATGVYDENKILDYGNDLVWNITYPSGTSRDVATIGIKGDAYYLKVNSIGEIDVTCSNEKNTIERTFHAILFDDSYVEEGTDGGDSTEESQTSNLNNNFKVVYNHIKEDKSVETSRNWRKAL